MAVLILSPKINVSRARDRAQLSAPLGDGYELSSHFSRGDRESWNLSVVLRTAELNAIAATFQVLAGATSFEWQPKPEVAQKSYTCKLYRVKRLELNHYELTATFDEFRDE